MTAYPDGKPFNAADIRHLAGMLRRHGVDREEAIATCWVPPAQRRPFALTDIEVRRIFDEVWPPGDDEGQET